MAMTLKEMERWQFRVNLFQQHGWPEDRAESWADKLVLRDRDRDDLRLCVECAHLMSQWRCRKRGAVIAEVLQRCDMFAWKMPAPKIVSKEEE